MKLTFSPSFTMHINPGALQAALPDGYELVDHKSVEEGGIGRAAPGRRGHIDKSQEQVFFKGDVLTIEDLLFDHLFPLLSPKFDASEALTQLKALSPLATANGLLSNTTTLGRTLSALSRKRPDELGRVTVSGKKLYVFTPKPKQKGETE